MRVFFLASPDELNFPYLLYISRYFMQYLHAASYLNLMWRAEFVAFMHSPPRGVLALVTVQHGKEVAMHARSQ